MPPGQPLEESEPPRRKRSRREASQAPAARPARAVSGVGAPAKRKRGAPTPKARPARQPAEKPKRGRWRGGTLLERWQRIRWIAGWVWRLRVPIALAAGLIIILIYVNRPVPQIAPLFTQEVQYWAPQLIRWSMAYGVEVNVLATLMQIESCGWPDAESSVGAQGLFQVMPFHFDEAEQARMTDPELNAQKGAGVIADCLRRAKGNVGLAMACYNGGPSLINVSQDNWPAESRSYYQWGTGIYGDAQRGLSRSETLEAWLEAGGVGLCQRAAARLRLPTPSLALRATSTPRLPTSPVSASPSASAPSGPPSALPPNTSPPGALPTYAFE
jgi:soluble lytic murein transglycosylase-like protein